MPNILTADEVREHIETDLVDDALQRIIDAADAEIIRKLGALDSQTDVLQGGSRYLHLSRKASAITAVSERYNIEMLGLTVVPLAADDYRLLADGRRIERLQAGTNGASCWQGEVEIESTPADAGLAERKALLVKLVQLDLQYSGLDSQSVGDVTVKQKSDLMAERAALFGQLGHRRLIT